MKRVKTFLATHATFGGAIRVVIVAGAERPAVLLLHRRGRQRAGDHRGVRRSRGHRTGVSRREGSLGQRPAAGAEPLGQHRRVASQPVALHAGGTVGLGQSAKNSRTATTRRGTMRTAARLTPTAAKPCRPPAWRPNFRTCPTARSPRKIRTLSNVCCASRYER